MQLNKMALIKLPPFRYIVEPVLLMFIFSTMIATPLIQQYVYKKFSDDVHFTYEYTNDTSTCGAAINNETQKKLQDQVQSTVAHFNIGLTFCWTFSSLISALIYGALSDQVGRRTILIINCIGSFLDASTMFLSMLLNLSPFMFYLGVIINGLSGAYSGLFMILCAYLADVTEEKDMPMRLAILEFTNLFAICLGFFTSGPFIKQFGFILTQGVILGLYAAAGLYTFFILKESLGFKKNDKTKESLSPLKESENDSLNAKETYGAVLRKLHQYPVILFKVLTKKRPKRALMHMSIVILVFVNCFTFGVFPVVILYLMNRPFCWPPLEIGNYLGTQMLTLAVGTVVGLKLFSLFLPRYFVGLLGPIFAFAGYVVLSLARTKTMAYAALGIRTFSSLHTPIFRSKVSELVDKTEQGSIFAAVSTFEITFTLVASFVFNFPYAKMNAAGRPDLFFYIPAGCLFVPFIMIIAIWIKYGSGETKEEEESDDNSLKKEVSVEDEEKEAML